jgi:isoquinoline 1-oxidoreductase subunit alpha
MEILVNGVARPLPDDLADPALPLLWALRDLLGLTGTKFGCGVAACGACTVHVDGKAVRSCVTPLEAVRGKRVDTIEALGSAERPHPLQRAWVVHQVPQCGYCQSGMLMAAGALLAKNRQPSDADIDAAITNLCRCGTYPRIRAAIKAAAAQMTPVAGKKARA